MKQISKMEIYLKKRLDELGITYHQQVPFKYHTFENTLPRCRKYKTYTADFVLDIFGEIHKEVVVEVKGWSSHDTFRVLKPFIYDYLTKKGYEFKIVNATKKDIDKFIKELKDEK